MIQFSDSKRVGKFWVRALGIIFLNQNNSFMKKLISSLKYAKIMFYNLSYVNK